MWICTWILNEAVKVVVRCRPLMSKETAAKYKNIVKVSNRQQTIEVQGKVETKRYTFDQVYGRVLGEDWNFVIEKVVFFR